ncbi:MAG: ABC transporter permease [Saprospiraceae bacterium]|nr:ABC transporter permease [Saprospiraceae bacterium]MCB9324796.1 ABC transporter permease [Lewinellaceae bacterium]
MFKYIVKRVLLFIPTLIVISFLAFGLSKCTPGDPVENMMPDDMNHTERSYRQAAGRLGLDKPAFYVDFTATAYPDTLYKFVKKYKRKAIQKLIGQYGNWPLIEQYYLQINHFEDQLALLPGGVGEKARAKVLPELKLLETDFKDPSILNRLRRMENALQADSTVGNQALSGITALKQKYEAVKLNPSRGKLFIPAFRWYGFDNQYHHWAGKFLKGDFGISYMNGQPVATKIWSALKWTLLINGVAIFIAYLFSIPIGVIAATRQGKPFDRITSVALFMLHSLPSFWVATLLIVFFTTPEYGMDWFPTLGLGDIPTGASFWEVIRIRGWHMVLPVFALSYGALAFISRQMRGSMVDVLRQDYVRTARAKGLKEKAVVWKHAFRNALFPIITMFASVLPASIAGSVVIEVIFNIHGMGKVVVDSIFRDDWPLVYAVLMLASVLTMVGILLADILYALADPRIRLGKR